MPKKQQQHKKLRPQPPLVLVSGFSRDYIWPMLELAREWGWELRGTWISTDEWHEARPFAGALTRDLPTGLSSRRLGQAAIPAVRLGEQPHPDDRRLPAVLPDLAAAGRLAAGHFAERGFKEVAYIGYDPADPEATTHAMYIAFRQSAAERGMGCRLLRLKTWDKENKSNREARRARGLMAWLEDLPKPVGVFCFNDIMAEEVGLACAQTGLLVPEEVAILGYGNSLQCEITPVRLSSVDPGLAERVHAAMRVLRRLIDGEPAPAKPVMVPPAVIVERQSTNVLAVSDPLVARALRFIWNHFDDPRLAIDDIAAETRICRRTLERKFRRCLRRGIGAELRRKRLEHCRTLLAESDLPLSAAAPKVGFSSPSYLHKAFTKAFGMPPGEFRAKKS